MRTSNHNQKNRILSERPFANVIKGLIIILVFLVISQCAFAQVGIGTTTPDASSVLDVTSTEGGVLIPRMPQTDRDNITSPATGLLIYQTDNTPGFYFYNGSTWTIIGSGDKNTLDQAYDQGGPGLGRFINATDGQVNIYGSHGLYVSNNSSVDNDDALLVRKSGSGRFQDALSIEFLGSVSSTSSSPLNSINNRIEIDATNSPITALNNSFINSNNTGRYKGVYNNFYSVTGASSFIGTRNDFASNSGSQTGLFNFFVSTVASDAIGVSNTNIGGTGFFGTGNYIGVNNSFSNNTNGRYTYGIKNEISGTGDGEKYGSFTEILASAGGLHYGVYSDVVKATGYAGYFLGRLSVGTTTANNYILPASRGTSGYIIQSTGGNGTDWVDPSTVFTDTDNQNISGSGLSGTDLTIGIQNGTSEVIDLASLAGAQRIDDLIDGKSDNDGSEDGSSIFLGINAGSNDNGNDNHSIGIGFEALQHSQNKTNNTAIGYRALNQNGIGNPAVGGYGNTAIGYQSLTANIDGFRNTALGSNSLASNTDSENNVAIGSYALYGNTNGNHNTAIGSSSLSDNVIGDANTAIGYNALNENTGSANIAIGSYSGLRLSSGSNNIFIGNYAGFSQTSGSNRLHIDNYTDFIQAAGVPLIYGEFDNDILRINGEFQIGDPTSNGYSFPLTDGTSGQILVNNGINQLVYADASSIFTDTNTQNTLNQAYDQGGPGAGRIINATDGAFVITGTDGFQVSGTHGFGTSISGGLNTRMFFNPRKSAFRAGRADNTEWNDANVGNYSVAFGHDNTASGELSSAFGDNNSASGYLSFVSGFANTGSGSSSTAIGSNNHASGSISFTQGYSLLAPSYAEFSIGYFNSNYSPVSTTTANISDRLFNIGNGSASSRGNALTIYKSGLMNINDEYDMPLTDGLANEIMATDGAGHVNFVNVSTIFNDDQTIDTFSFNTSTNELTLEIEDDGIAAQTIDLSILDTGGDITAVTAGSGITGGGTTGGVTLTAAANNGLNIDTGADRIQLGGPLTEDTTITYGTFDTRFNLNDTGDFIIQDNGTNKLVVLDNGDTVLGGDLYWRDENTSGTVIARMIDDDNDGRLQIYENGTASISLDANGASIFNEQGFDRNFRVETNNDVDMFFIDGGTDRIGIGTTTPDYRLSVDGTLNLREDAGTGVAMRVEGNEAIYYNTATQLFSWGFGGTQNYFADDVGIGINAPIFKLDVRENNTVNYVAQIRNTNTGNDADGLRIQLGATTPGNANNFIGFINGAGAFRGRIDGTATGVGYNTTSDRRLKTNIEDIDNALAIINKIQPRLYEYKEYLGTKEYGFIAQELHPLYPQAVFGSPDSDVTKDPMMVDYGRLTPILTAGIKELNNKMKKLEKENALLIAKLEQLESLESRILALENKTETTQIIKFVSKN